VYFNSNGGYHIVEDNDTGTSRIYGSLDHLSIYLPSRVINYGGFLGQVGVEIWLREGCPTKTLGFYSGVTDSIVFNFGVGGSDHPLFTSL
jgi:hypothetical protein